MDAHACLKIEFTEGGKCQNLMSRSNVTCDNQNYLHCPPLKSQVIDPSHLILNPFIVGMVKIDIHKGYKKSLTCVRAEIDI